MTDQGVMQRFIRQILIFLRRPFTMIPLLLVTGVDPSRALVLGQLFLAFSIPLALVTPLIHTSNQELMGSMFNRWWTNVAATVVARAIIVLNVYLLLQTFGVPFPSGGGHGS